MAKLAALAAYIYQAVVALGLLVVMSNLLPASEFAAYSLFVTILQFVDIVCFQWLRTATTRFYPGPDAASEQRERGTIGAQFLASAVLCLLAGAGAMLFGVPLWLAAAAIVITVLQGWSEIHLTMLRFRQAFRLFSWLQGARISLLSAATLAGAAIGRDVGHAVAGTFIGNLVYLALSVALSRRILPWSHALDRASARRHLVYGGAAAGASIAGMLPPLALKTIFVSALGPAAAAGPLLALDLLQRPFGLIIGSLQAVRYPEIVERFDREGDTPALRIELGRYYAVLTGFAVLGAAGLVAVLAAAASLVVPAALRGSFLEAAPLVTLLALLRALTHTLLSTPAHLQHRLSAIMGLAAFDGVATCGGALIATVLMPGAILPIAGGAAAGAALAALLGTAMLRRQPFLLPRTPLLLAAAALALSWLSAHWFAGDLLLSTGVALAFAVALGSAPLVTLLRWIAH